MYDKRLLTGLLYNIKLPAKLKWKAEPYAIELSNQKVGIEIGK